MSLREDFKDILRNNVEGMNRDEAKYYVENDAIPESGSVSGLIYYSETEELARLYHDEMVEVINSNFGQLEKCPTANDLTWIAWSVILPEISDEIIKEIPLEIEVPESMISAFCEFNKGIYMDISDYVEDNIDGKYILINTSISINIEDFIHEMKALVFYKVDNYQDMDNIEDACNSIEEAYLDNEESVELVAKK